MDIYLACLGGILAHLLYFRHGEHHLQAPYVFWTALALPFLVSAILFQFGISTFVSALKHVCLLEATFSASLMLSTGIYRVFLHPTKHFPGPFLASLTKWYHYFLGGRSFQQHLFLDRLHHRYGDFVRTGPNEITIFTPEGIVPIHGAESLCSRTAWYDNPLPIFSVATIRTKVSHEPRRRVWDQGFSMKALRDHETVILKHASIMKDVIAAQDENHVRDFQEWLQYYGFDVMGEVQFNYSFNMLEHDKNRWVVDLIKDGNAILGSMTSLPWAIRVALTVPYLTTDLKLFIRWCIDRLSQRMQSDPSNADTIGWLLQHASENEGIKADWFGLVGDMMGMVLGGTEPVVNGMVFTLYHLAESPERTAKLRSEIKTLTSYSDNTQLAALPYLNALINETYRLHPGVPSGGLRTTPPAGLMIGGTFIPGGTTVLTPQYSIQKREDCFERAEEFIPERWTSRPEMVRDKRAFMPWGLGPFTCVGKNLGLMEIRTITVVLVDNFEISLADSEAKNRLLNGTLDYFAAVPGPLHLRMKKREPEAQIAQPKSYEK